MQDWGGHLALILPRSKLPLGASLLAYGWEHDVLELEQIWYGKHPEVFSTEWRLPDLSRSGYFHTKQHAGMPPFEMPATTCYNQTTPTILYSSCWRRVAINQRAIFHKCCLSLEDRASQISWSVSASKMPYSYRLWWQRNESLIDTDIFNACVITSVEPCMVGCHPSMHNDVCIIKGDNKLLCGRSGFPPPPSVLSGRDELYGVLVKTVQISALQELWVEMNVLLYDCPRKYGSNKSILMPSFSIKINHFSINGYIK